MRRFELFFVNFLFFLTVVEIRAANEDLSQGKEVDRKYIHEQKKNKTKDISQGNESAKSTSENLYDEGFLSEEKEEEKVSEEEIAINQAILKESVKKN